MAQIYYSDLTAFLIDDKDRVCHENHVRQMVFAFNFKKTFIKISYQGLLWKDLEVLSHLCRIKG